jgi:hypothetical protein
MASAGVAWSVAPGAGTNVQDGAAVGCWASPMADGARVVGAWSERRRTIDGVEQRLLRVMARISPRRWMFANRERMSRLLMLVCLDMRREANERDWAATIRTHLTGSAAGPRHNVRSGIRAGSIPADLKQHGSLRFKPPRKALSSVSP